jgi:hypothetical protein
MPNPKKIERKIHILAELAINEYDLDRQVIDRISSKAILINQLALESGYIETNVFMNEGGLFGISAYFDNGSVQITCFENSFDINIEINRKLFDSKINVSEQQVKSCLDLWVSRDRLFKNSQGTFSVFIAKQASIEARRQLSRRENPWPDYASSLGTSSILLETNSSPIYSGETPIKESPSLIQRVLIQKKFASASS